MTDFSNGLSRIINSGKNNSQSDITNIAMERLVTFQDVNGIVNPSIVDPSDPEFIALKKNIAQRGLDHPITVRPLPGDNTRYQVLCGHHRAAACEELGMATIKALVKRDLSDDDAALLVATDNFNRKKNYKPSEKAKAYKMALDAMKRKSVGRKIEGVEAEGRSVEELATLVGESDRNIKNYIRLTALIPEMLNMVDSKELKMVPAVELSYIPDCQQIIIYKTLTENPDIKITAALAKELRAKSERTELTESKVRATLGASPRTKKNPFNRKVKRLIPEYLTDPEQISQYLIDAITFYQEAHSPKEENNNE